MFGALQTMVILSGDKHAREMYRCARGVNPSTSGRNAKNLIVEVYCGVCESDLCLFRSNDQRICSYGASAA